jgi:hypothetical protein
MYFREILFQALGEEPIRADYSVSSEDAQMDGPTASLVVKPGEVYEA